jgi:DNA-directed RNA polymerase subunit RPC12/RpoP
MPAPPEVESQPEVVEFKCPQCGATTAYSVADGGLTCTHCGYYEPPRKEIVGKGAQEFEFTVETLAQAAHGWGEARKELECQNCGAHISLPQDALTATCSFCGSNRVIHREASQDSLRPRYLVPFKIEAAQCQEIAQKWLGSSWMTPKMLALLAKLAGFAAIYLPFWTFDSLATASWKAEVGHTETEQYYDHSSKSWKSRAKTVWRWETGQARVPFDDLLVQGTNRLSAHLLGQIKDHDLKALRPYESKYLAGLQAQAYDVPLERAWEIGRQEMREGTRQACLDQASSSQVRNFSMNLDFQDESWRYILLPVYLAAYSYEDKIYQVMVNGQTGSIAGQRPVDWRKVWLAIAALLAPGLILGLIGLLTVSLGGIGASIGVVGFVLLVIGLILSFILFQKAQGLDDD